MPWEASMTCSRLAVISAPGCCSCGIRMAEKPMERPALRPGRLAMTPASTWTHITWRKESRSSPMKIQFYRIHKCMLTILAGEPLASMMIVLRSEFFTRWPTVSVVLSIVKSWQQPGPATASLSARCLSLALCTSGRGRKPESFWAWQLRPWQRLSSKNFQEFDVKYDYIRFLFYRNAKEIFVKVLIVFIIKTLRDNHLINIHRIWKLKDEAYDHITRH